jgi:cytoskeleton protein RodZ
VTQQTAQSLGQLLAQARINRGLSLSELHDATMVSVKFLMALEQDAHDELPSPAYIKGYLRRIAEVLKTPAEPLLAAYDESLRPAQAAAEVSVAPALNEEKSCNPSSGRNYFIDLVRLTQHLLGYLWSDIFPWIRDRLPAQKLLLALLILVFAIFIYRLWPAATITDPSNIEQPTAELTDLAAKEPAAELLPEEAAEVTIETPPSTEPLSALDTTANADAEIQEVVPLTQTTRSAAEPSLGPDRIDIDFFGPSVVRITDANGNTIASGLKRAGESLRARGTQPFSIQVGNPSVTDIRVNGIVVQGTPL